MASRSLDALAVDDGNRLARPIRQFPALHVERVVNAVERAVPFPALGVVIDRAARRQVLRDLIPLTSRAQQIHQPVDHLTDIDRPLVAAPLGGRDQRRDQRPLLVRQVARIAKLVKLGQADGRMTPEVSVSA